MSTSPLTPRQDLKWYELSQRHLQISECLLTGRFADGSCFHTYHAFECAVGAIIIAKGYLVPPDGKTYGPRRMIYYQGPSGQINEPSTHKVRLILFDQVADRTKPYYTTFSTLKTFLPPLRNQTLYYDRVRNLLPEQQFNESRAKALYEQVKKWVEDVRGDIP